MSNTRFAAAVSAAGLAMILAAPVAAAPSVTARTTNDVYCVSANQVQTLPTVPASNRFQILAGVGAPTNNGSSNSNGIGTGNIGLTGGVNYDIIAPGGRSFGLDASYQYSNFNYNNTNPNNTSGSLNLDTNDFMLDGRVKIGCSANAWWFVGAGAGSTSQSFTDPLGNTNRNSGFASRFFIGGEDANGAGVQLRYVMRPRFFNTNNNLSGCCVFSTNSWELLLTIRPGEVWQQGP